MYQVGRGGGKAGGLAPGRLGTVCFHLETVRANQGTQGGGGGVCVRVRARARACVPAVQCVCVLCMGCAPSSYAGARVRYVFERVGSVRLRAIRLGRWAWVVAERREAEMEHSQ